MLWVIPKWFSGIYIGTPGCILAKLESKTCTSFGMTNLKSAIKFFSLPSAVVFWYANRNKNLWKISAAAEYFGHHVGIHAPIFTKIVGLWEDIGPDQNLIYLQNTSIDGWNIGHIRWRSRFFRSLAGRVPEPKRVALGSCSLDDTWPRCISICTSNPRFVSRVGRELWLAEVFRFYLWVIVHIARYLCCISSKDQLPRTTR